MRNRVCLLSVLLLSVLLTQFTSAMAFPGPVIHGSTSGGDVGDCSGSEEGDRCLVLPHGSLFGLEGNAWSYLNPPSETFVFRDTLNGSAYEVSGPLADLIGWVTDDRAAVTAAEGDYLIEIGSTGTAALFQRQEGIWNPVNFPSAYFFFAEGFSDGRLYFLEGSTDRSTGLYSFTARELERLVRLFGDGFESCPVVELLGYPDSDEDGYGAIGSSPRGFCGALPAGYAENAVDCDDADPDTFPGAPEICDGRDNDCAGGIPAEELDNDLDGFRACSGDCDDADPHAFPGAPEICDGRDNDCAGGIPAEELDNDLDGFLACAGDCDDANPDTFPGAPEICDGRDNDCADGIPAEELDNDLDGFSSCDGDCNDFAGDVYPDAPEVCDGVDNNCDANIDDADPLLVGATDWYPDCDGDAAFSIAPGATQCEEPLGIGICTGGAEPFGWIGTAGLDCDDENAGIFPGAIEVCDLVDNDCNGVVDDECLGTCIDGLINQDETDVDCGGKTCGPCADGQGCAVDTDCDSLSCGSDGICQSR